MFELLDVPHTYIKKLNLVCYLRKIRANWRLMIPQVTPLFKVANIRFHLQANDPAQWSCWEIIARLWTAKEDEVNSEDATLRSVSRGIQSDIYTIRHDVPFSNQPRAIQCRDVVIIAMRRKFIPPFMDTSQDFVICMFSPSIYMEWNTHSRNRFKLNNRSVYFDAKRANTGALSLQEVR